MSKKYYIRVYESRDRDGKTDPGTLVVPIDSFLSLYAETTDQATRQSRQQVENGKLPRGQVYQICPSLSVPELIRPVAASPDGSFERVFLDPASELYGKHARSGSR